MQPCMLRKRGLMCKLASNKENTASGAICHLYKLDEYGSVPYVALKQKDNKGCGIANKFFQDRSSMM